jgi:adenylosuccinate synthase
MINGVTQIVMTKSDVLDEFPVLHVCEAYNIDGKKVAQVPYQMQKTDIDPVYTPFEGWMTDITKIDSYAALPERMKTYIAHINDRLGVPVRYISNGPGRTQIIDVQKG